MVGEAALKVMGAVLLIPFVGSPPALTVVAAALKLIAPLICISPAIDNDVEAPLKLIVPPLVKFPE